MQPFFVLAFLAALAGRVLSLQIAVGGSVGNITADQFLDISDATLKNDCQSMCDPGTSAIQACGGDDNCLCRNDTITAITACEQCYFTDLISRNIPMPDPRAGSMAALMAYATACNSSVQVIVPTTLTALTLPADWDGPTGIALNTVATVFVVGFGGIMGGAFLLMLSNLE